MVTRLFFPDFEQLSLIYLQRTPLVQKKRSTLWNFYNEFNPSVASVTVFLMSALYCARFKEIPLNYYFFLGTTLLNRAVDNNDTDLVGYLIRNGADVNKPVNGINPIHKSIIQKKTDILRLLLTSSTNADVSIQMVSNGNSPLHLAIEKCDLETVNILLQYGSDTTLKNRHGDTALHVAAKIAFAESFRLLVEHGANVSLINSKGETALDIASRQKGFEGSNFVEWLS